MDKLDLVNQAFFFQQNGTDQAIKITTGNKAKFVLGQGNLPIIFLKDIQHLVAGFQNYTKAICTGESRCRCTFDFMSFCQQRLIRFKRNCCCLDY